MNPADLARSVAKDSALTVEAKVTRYSKRADGGINIGFAVHPHGKPASLADIELGDRGYLVWFPVNDQEEVPSTDRSYNINPRTTPPNVPTPASEVDNPGQVKSLAQMAGMYCTMKLFQQFLNIWAPIGTGPVIEEKSAAEALRRICRVKSRSEIKIATAAGDRFEQLVSDYHSWKLADEYVEHAN